MKWSMATASLALASSACCRAFTLSRSSTTTFVSSSWRQGLRPLSSVSVPLTEEAIEAVGGEDTSIYVQEAEALGKLKSGFLQTMRDRGFLHQCTGLVELDKQLSAVDEETKEPLIVSAYLGFDATADSLHVGSLLQIMILY